MQLLKLIFNCLIISCLMTFFACQNDTDNSKKVEEETTTVEGGIVEAVGTGEEDVLPTENESFEVDSIESQRFIKEKLPILYGLSKDNAVIAPALYHYAYMVLNAEKTIKNEATLQSIFNERDNQLIPVINEQILDPLATEQEEFFNEEKGGKLLKELSSIGMNGVFAEGFYMGLAPEPMLANALKHYASAPFQCLMDFKSGEGMAQGGEYPYMNLEGEAMMVAAAEKLLTSDPKHEYNKMIERTFRSALTVLTDFHKVDQAAKTSYLVHDLATEHYPSATDKESLQYYTKKYPDSKYTPLINKLLGNPSELAYDKKKGWRDLYLVVVSWEAAKENRESGLCAAARQKVFGYLDKGIDIPHSLLLWKGEQRECAIVHRFFVDEAKAKTAKSAIESQLDGGETVSIEKAKLDTKTFTWKILEE